MSGLSSATILVKVALVVVIVGFLFNLIGFATPYWTVIDLPSFAGIDFSVHQGLWLFCSGTSCSSISGSLLAGKARGQR
jgi:hypothetical protein